MATTTPVGSNLKVAPVSLKEFNLYNQNQPSSLSDFQTPIDAAAPVSNTPSNANTAAYAAALDPMAQTGQQMIDNYKTALAEGNSYGVSGTATTAITSAVNQHMQANKQSLFDILGDPNIDDATKKAAVENTYNASHFLYSPQNMMTTKALAQPVEGQVNQEVEKVRYDMAKNTAEFNANKLEQQQILNAELSKSQPDLQQHIFDLGMNLVPFTRQYMMAKIKADQSNAPVSAFIKTFIGGLGNATADVRESIAKLPMDQQLDAAQNIANIINQHSNILISTPNDEFRRQALQSILGSQGYGTSQQVADNIGSWLDLTLLGGTAVKGARAASGAFGDIKAGVGAGTTLNDSKAFFRTFEENYAKEKAAATPDTASAVASRDAGVVPEAPYEKVNKNSLGQFQRSRETQFYDSSNGVPYQQLPAENKLSNAIRDGMRSGVQPVSYFQNIKDVNPDMTRAAFQAIALDTTEEAARAMTGTSRADAMAAAMAPEVAHVDGSVSAKVAQVDGPLTAAQDAVPAEVMDFLNRDGFTQYAQNEKAAARGYVKQNFQDAVGMTPRGEMFQYVPDMSRTTDTPQGFHFVGVYGPMNSGFSDAQEALSTAQYALRNTGVDESAIKLLRRDGDRYIPTDLSEVNALGDNHLKDYLISVNHNYQFDARTVDEAKGWQPLDVKMNFFDRVLVSSGRSGTFASHLFDKASQLDKLVVGSSVVGVDRMVGVEKAWLKHVGTMASDWKKLDKNIQQTLLDEIQDANLNSRPYEYTRLAARGIPQSGVDFLRNLQQTNDGLWFLKNQYYAKQLDKAGYTEFVHPGTNTNLPVKEIKESTAGIAPAKARQVSKVWNPDTDTVDVIKQADIDTLYSQNGRLGRLRQPVITPNGDVAEHVIIPNNPNAGFTRNFTANSKVLNYRPGYYGVQYKDPWHIVERVPDAAGNVVYEHSVATAKNTAVAQDTAARMNSTATSSTLADGKPRFFHRKAYEQDLNGGINAEYDVEQAQGMSSFKRRGKLLEDSNSNITSLASSHVANPVEVMVNQIRSLSNKVVMQDVIDAQARRGISQYAEFLPKDRFGDPVIPTDLREIRYRGGVNSSSSDIADARTTFGYVNYLRHGYANALDDGVKAGFHMVADKFGELGLGKVEEVSRGLGDKSLTNGLKSVSYYAYMGTSPLHQIVLQGQQAAMLLSLNPTWVGSLKAFSQPAYLSLRTLGIDAGHDVAQQLAKSAWGSSQAAEDAYKQFVRTGLGAAVDHQNMVSGAVNDMAENMIASARQDLVSKGLAVPRATAGFLRKIGFDAGEFYSSTMSWLAHRDMAEKMGQNVLDDAIADSIHAASRNFTGNMNAAGAMPYDKNALGFLFQYMSNQHKMLLNLATNRAIPIQTKIALGTLGTVLYGAGQWHIFDSATASLPEGEVKDAVRYGLEGWSLNKMLGFAFGGKSQIDWSSLSPFNAYNFLDSLHQMMTERTLGAMIAGSPSLNMFFGNNPRVANAYQSALAYTHLRDDYQDNSSLLQVASDFAKISSGYSAGMKAKYLLELQKKVSANGKTTDEDLDKVNAIGAALGFPTMRESQLYQVQQMMLTNKKQVEQDFNEWYRLANQHYADANLTGSDLDHAQRMLNEFYRAYGTDNPIFNEMMDKKLKQDIRDGSSNMYSAILRNCSLYNKGDCLDLINKAPFSNENDRETLKQIVTYGNQFKPELYDGKKE